MKITASTMDKVYQSKLSSVETIELRGYELIDTLFVDSSGLGLESEPALTQSGFERELSQIIKDNGGEVYTWIVSAGMFQVYVGVFKKTGVKHSKVIANNTLEVYNDDGKVQAIRLHDTNIITYHDDGTIELSSGGWRTKTTKERLNAYLPSGWWIEQKNWEWYLHKNDERIEFEDGMRIQL